MSCFQISFPEDQRFDERRLRIKDDGADFEIFVYESLSLSFAASDRLRPGFGRGRDGAIDHLVEGEREYTIIECKFTSRHSESTPRDRWSEVRGHLNGNLPILAGRESNKRSGSPYAPWLDSHKPITSYVFCVSVPFPHAQGRLALEKQIADDFLKLSQLDPRLAHLARISIQVRGWDDFHGELRRCFPLRYRWFGDLPQGILPVRDDRFESRSFRRFLFDESLPFFSRENFVAARAARHITEEEQLVKNLSAENEDAALILAGPGGVGKTRLALELCERLSKLGWLPLRLTDNITKDSIAELTKAHAEPAKLVLLSDYAERADALSAISEEVARINDGNAHRLRLIATCRMSAFSSVQDALAPLVPSEVVLGSRREADADEGEFTDWVVRQILNFGKLPEIDQMSRICRGLPILAAFSVFLYQRDRGLFFEQFGQLTGIEDFRDWVKRRLDILLHVKHAAYEKHESRRRLALLALRLPMHVSEAETLADNSALDRLLLEQMRLDRWIEDNRDETIATHDVFADAMIAHYVFEIRASGTMRLGDLLRAAIQEDVLERALVVTDRLAGHPDFEAIDGLSIVRSLLARASASVIAAHEYLLKGRLLSTFDKIQLLIERTEMPVAVAANRECDTAVSKIAETIARSRNAQSPVDDRLLENALEVMAPLVAATLSNVHPSNLLLRRAFELFPDIYRSRVLSRIAIQPTLPETHYLLVAWLQTGVPVEEISAATQTWLAWNAGRTPKTSFVVRAWLEAGGQRELIDESVLEWIAAFGKTERARFVYRAWLKAGGQRELIDESVLGWIAAFGNTELAGFVYRAWLEAGGQRELIDESVLGWIAAFLDTERAGYVYRAWLDAGGQRELIDGPVLEWIAAFGKTERARFVYRAWLEAGGQRELIDESVLGWIAAFGNTERAGFVYRAWLDAGGQLEAIEKDMLAWLKTYGAKEIAKYVYYAFLSSGGDFERVSLNCLDWFREYAETIDAGFVLKYIARQKDLPRDILHAAIRWCVLFSYTEDAVWRLTSLFPSYVHGEEDVALVRAFIAVLSFLDLNRLSAELPPHGTNEDGCILSFFVLNTLGLSLGVIGLGNEDREELKTAHGNLLKRSAVYEASRTHGTPYIYPAIIHHVAELIECGIIDMHRDRPQLVRFADWMRAWPENAREDLEIAVSALRRAAPSDLWDLPPSDQQPLPKEASWAWKDSWQNQWNSAGGDSARLVSLALQAKIWLSNLDLEQMGWTSVWKILWDANDDAFTSRTQLADLAMEWLKVVDAGHPRWPSVWSTLWAANQSDGVRADSLAALAQDWLKGQGSRPASEAIRESLRSRPGSRNLF